MFETESAHWDTERLSYGSFWIYTDTKWISSIKGFRKAECVYDQKYPDKNIQNM